jgi:hypothetical protein
MMFFMSNVLLASMIQGKSNSLHRLREEETRFAALHSIVRGGHQRRMRLLRKAPPLLSTRASEHGPVVPIQAPCSFSSCATSPVRHFEEERGGVEFSAIDDLPKVVTIADRDHAEYKGLLDGRIHLQIRVATIIITSLPMTRHLKRRLLPVLGPEVRNSSSA